MTLLVIIIVLAVLFDYINGFHDSANAITNIVSTKVLTPFQAVIWAAFFNFVAYFIFREHGVANTIAKTVHAGTNEAGIPYITLPVILSGLIAAIAWNLLTWRLGIPSSSSHTLIGGFAGAAIAHGGFGAISSGPIILIIAFIFLAPLIGMLFSFVISLYFLNAFRKTLAPKIVAVLVIGGMILLLSYMLHTNPESLNEHTRYYLINVILDSKNIKWILLCGVIIVMAVFSLFLSYMNYAQSERWFKRMQLIGSAAFSIGHGGNDAQKVMGIIMVALIAFDPGQYQLENMVRWIPITCYTAISLGTLSGGWKIVKTMGTKITKITPFEGIAGDTAGALTLYITEFLKVPVSTTHTVAGSIMGAGATKRLSAVRWGVTANLLWAWILTIPVSAVAAMVIYWILKLFGVG